jgi:hypothetical protein
MGGGEGWQVSRLAMDERIGIGRVGYARRACKCEELIYRGRRDGPILILEEDADAATASTLLRTRSTPPVLDSYLGTIISMD